MTIPHRVPRSLRIAVAIAGLVLAASACHPTGSEATLLGDAPPPAMPHDFCTTWHLVGPDMIGGPSAAGPEALGEYLDGLVDGFGQLIAAAHTEPTFPASALDDLIEYRDDLALLALTPDNPGAVPGDTDLRDRVEVFVISSCGEPGDGAGDGGDTIEDDDEAGPSSDCGSRHFILLVATADSLGVDHAATSQPFVDAIQTVADGIDPGPELDDSDLSVLTTIEEIGCQGSQAMQQLLVDNGFGDVLEDSSLGG